MKCLCWPDPFANSQTLKDCALLDLMLTAEGSISSTHSQKKEKNKQCECLSELNTKPKYLLGQFVPSTRRKALIM